jgi:diguanylate cyclase (GGDEF)-like protein
MRDNIKQRIFINYLDELTRKYDEIFSLKEKLMKELQEKATYDLLTGLYNRYALFDFLEKELQRLKRKGKGKIYVIFVDLDNFKIVNDNFGHKKGDEILKAVAELLKENFRPYDIVSRFGGDEFVIVITDDKDSCHDVSTILHRIRKLIEETFSAYSLSISYGVAVAPDEGTDAYQLIQLADNRMYEMKNGKKGRTPPTTS